MKIWGVGILAVIFLTAMSGVPKIKKGDVAPDFILPDLTDQDMRLTDYHGEQVLLHFWATWCKPCVKELPEIEAGYQALRDQGFVVLAIDVGEDKQQVREFADRLGLTFPILLDSERKTAERYNIAGLPVSIFISRQGIIQEKVSGGSLTRENIKERINPPHKTM